MKKSSLLVFAIAGSFIFSSCSSNEEGLISTDSNAKLLKNYTVKRDASGAYSMDFNVLENTKVDKVIGINKNSSEFYLYSSDKNTTTKIAEQLLINNNQLKVGFVDTKTDSKTNVVVFDDNISFKKSAEESKLTSYSVTKNEEGSFELDFEVADNVAVEYIFNENEDAFEIHLTNGKSATTNFSTTLEKTEGKPLNIVFVNFIANPGAKTTETIEPIRKPVIIIVD